MINVPRVLNRNEVCTQTYIVVNTFDTLEEAINFRDYLKTKFIRWLLHITSSGMHLNRKSFMFVPILDFTKKWSDTDLYKRYKLSNDEIVYIESIIKQMD